MHINIHTAQICQDDRISVTQFATLTEKMYMMSNLTYLQVNGRKGKTPKLYHDR